MEAISALSGSVVPQEEWARIMNPDEREGTSLDVLVETARKYVPEAASFGEGAYEGGVAILNVRNILSRRGHFVLALREEEKGIEFFDPFWSRFFVMRENEFEWSSGDGSVRKWALNFRLARPADLRTEDDFDEKFALCSLRRWLEGKKAGTRAGV